MAKRFFILLVMRYIGIFAGLFFIMYGLFSLLPKKGASSVPITALGFSLLNWLLTPRFLRKVSYITSILYAIIMLWLLFTGYWTSRI